MRICLRLISWCLAVVLVVLTTACTGTPSRKDGPRAHTLPPPQESAPRFHHPRDVRRMFVSSDGQRLVTFDASTIAVWSLPDMTPLRVAENLPDLEFLDAVSISPDGHRVAFLNPYKHLWLWDTEEDALREVLVHYSFQPDLLVGFTPSGDLLWRSGTSLIRWSPSTDALDVIGSPGYMVASSGSSSHGFLLWGADPHILGFDPSSGEPRLKPLDRWWNYAGQKITPLLSPNQNHLFIFERAEPIRLDLAAQQDVAFETDAHRASLQGVTQNGRPRPTDVELSEDGEQVILALTRSVEVWDAESGALLSSFSPPADRVREIHPRLVHDIAVTADGLYVLCPGQVLLRYELGSWALLDSWDL